MQIQQCLKNSNSFSSGSGSSSSSDTTWLQSLCGVESYDSSDCATSGCSSLITSDFSTVIKSRPRSRVISKVLHMVKTKSVLFREKNTNAGNAGSPLSGKDDLPTSVSFRGITGKDYQCEKLANKKSKHGIRGKWRTNKKNCSREYKRLEIMDEASPMLEDREPSTMEGMGNRTKEDDASATDRESSSDSDDDSEKPKKNIHKSFIKKQSAATVQPGEELNVPVTNKNDVVKVPIMVTPSQEIESIEVVLRKNRLMVRSAGSAVPGNRLRYFARNLSNKIQERKNDMKVEDIRSLNDKTMFDRSQSSVSTMTLPHCSSEDHLEITDEDNPACGKIDQNPVKRFSRMVESAIDEVKGSVSDVVVSATEVLNAFKIDEEELSIMLGDVSIARHELSSRALRFSTSKVQTFRIYEHERQNF